MFFLVSNASMNTCTHNQPGYSSVHCRLWVLIVPSPIMFLKHLICPKKLCQPFELQDHIHIFVAWWHELLETSNANNHCIIFLYTAMKTPLVFHTVHWFLRYVGESQQLRTHLSSINQHTTKIHTDPMLRVQCSYFQE